MTTEAATESAAQAGAAAAEAAAPAKGTDAGTSAATNGTAVNGNGKAADPFADLDTGTREWVGKAGIADVKTLAEKARNAESLIGKSIQVPGEKADASEWGKVFDKLGRPKEASGYEFKLPEGVPAEMPYDGEFANKAKGEFHSLGLSAKQAQGVHDFYVRQMGEQFKLGATSQAEGMVNDAKSATEALETHFGAKRDSDSFAKGVEITARAVKELGGEKLVDAMTKRGLLNGDGLIMEPQIAIAFHKAGLALYKEDSFETGTAAGGKTNPFAAEKPNWTEIHTAIRSDPEGSRRLIAAAGKQPGDFGLK